MDMLNGYIEGLETALALIEKAERIEDCEIDIKLALESARDSANKLSILHFMESGQ